jgi:hypothetical protein
LQSASPEKLASKILTPSFFVDDMFVELVEPPVDVYRGETLNAKILQPRFSVADMTDDWQPVSGAPLAFGGAKGSPSKILHPEFQVADFAREDGMATRPAAASTTWTSGHGLPPGKVGAGELGVDPSQGGEGEQPLRPATTKVVRHKGIAEATTIAAVQEELKYEAVARSPELQHSPRRLQHNGDGPQTRSKTSRSSRQQEGEPHAVDSLHPLANPPATITGALVEAQQQNLIEFEVIPHLRRLASLGDADLFHLFDLLSTRQISLPAFAAAAERLWRDRAGGKGRGRGGTARLISRSNVGDCGRTERE